nr:PREDICTED: BURP domain-containing protein 3-like [Musa acuminata subsp. malaccensis]
MVGTYVEGVVLGTTRSIQPRSVRLLVYSLHDDASSVWPTSGDTPGRKMSLKPRSGMRHLSRPCLRALTCFSERRTRALKQPYKAKASGRWGVRPNAFSGRSLGRLNCYHLATVCHASSSPAQVIYWNSVLPDTPMPRAISDLITTEVVAGEKDAATDTQLHDDPNVALFFLEKDLHPGAKMKLHFTNTISGASFLRRRAADSIPFSSTRLREILDRFSVEPNSAEAAAIKQTLRDCEEPAVRGERKTCATSLEAMVEFSTSSLGTSKVKAASTTVSKEGTPAQEYTVAASGVREMGGEELATCHAEPYAYAIFYCHATSTSRGYEVDMVGKDGTTVEAAAVCHTDTTAWNPEHVAFKVLDIKPGSAPVCHFLPQDHVVWSRSG